MLNRPNPVPMRGPDIALYIFWLGAANVVAFMAVALIVGGDAWAGHVVDGHYFLGMKGRYTEVSRAIFLYSYWHVASLMVTQPLALLAVVRLGWPPW